MKKIHYREWGIESPRYWGLLAVLAAIVAVGGFATLYMEHEGHWVTGMTNQIVWGTPHVFAIFLIVAASGAGRGHLKKGCSPGLMEEWTGAGAQADRSGKK